VRKPVVLTNCGGIVRETLARAKFDQIFSMA